MHTNTSASALLDREDTCDILLITRLYLGALNWATGETVAVKEIQLSNIPKGELGQIMVRRASFCVLYNR